MRALSATELLNLWEHGSAQTPAQRALTLLHACCPETPAEQLNRLSVAQRDVRLLALREQLFGPRFDSITTCPACGERLEFSIDGADIRTASQQYPNETYVVTYTRYSVQFRLPNSLDLASLDPAADDQANRRHLLQLCVIAAQNDGAEIAAADLPQEVVTAISQRMAEADLDSDVRLALSCPACHHAWQAPLDIVSFFWTEIHSWAGRTLHEIHTLASEYGWREADVLALSPRRRQTYLEMMRHE
jgi:hypothetical protein